MNALSQPKPTTAKHIAKRIKQLESALCNPMPYGDRKAASQEYCGLCEIMEAINGTR